ncbi:DoxX family protein [Flavobacterium sp. FlaQc-57]|uniref:DoxX family protein n=1 Tax=Flavobacterium sp. FlaQc-57 TaxID=3374186 RepID=UPI003756811B
MKTNTNFKKLILDTICLLFALLFTYAAASKLFDFENFRIQLGQSPLLSSFADWISITVPVSEFIIAFVLLLKRFRLAGLYAAYMLMIMFTAYIYIILNFSSFVPCSCGGILEKMTWEEHLIFNICFVILAVIGIAFNPEKSILIIDKSGIMGYKLKIIILLICTVFGCGIVVLLFNRSEHMIHYENKFIRRFPQHAAQEIHQADLIYNSYYFAGSSNGKIYLGNYTAPLQIMELDSALKTRKIYRIELKQQQLDFSSPQIRVKDQNFYVFEGVVPYIFKGNTASWKASLRINSGYYFSHLEPMDSVNMAIRYMKPKKGESLMGTLNLSDTTKVKYAPLLLQKQFDGIFDTDGSFHFSGQLNKIVYVYLYRNQYIVSDKDLNLDYRGNTIDTVSHAQIKLEKLKNSNMKTFSKPPLIVNKLSAVEGNLLYVNSALPGLYESEDIWKTASIIDVYDLTNKTYRSSFPIYNIGKKTIRSIYVSNNYFYALIGEKIVCYKLREHLKQSSPVIK